MTTGWHICWPRHRLALSCLVLSPAENSASPWLARPQKIPVQKSVRCRQVSPSCRERTRHQETVVLQGNNLGSWQDARFTSTGRKARPLGPTRVEQTRLPLSVGTMTQLLHLASDLRKNNTQRRGPGTPQSGHVPRTRPPRKSTHAHKQSTRIGRAPLSSFAVPERAARAGAQNITI